MRQYGPTLVLEIPGYKILRQLGRGGMATVYLATQESVQREIALKVMSRVLLTDPDFSERFQREVQARRRGLDGDRLELGIAQELGERRFEARRIRPRRDPP